MPLRSAVLSSEEVAADMTAYGWSIVWFLLIVVLYAFLTLSETALTTMSDKRIAKLAETDRRAARISRILSQPGRFIATIRADTALLCMFAGALAFSIFPGPLAGWFGAWGLPLPGLWAVLCVGLLLAFLLLLFGVAVPKLVAGKKDEAIALRVGGLLKLILLLTGWFAAFVGLCARGVCRLFRIQPQLDDERVTEEEIRMLVDVGEEKGVIQQSEKFMIDNIFEFGDKTAGDIMTHRTDVAAIDAASTLDEVLAVVAEEKYSRFPIYEETLDDIIGTIHVKDLMPFVENRSLPFDLHSVLHRPYIAPESKKADELFRDLKRSKKYIAIIIDEYGGTAGIVTMEDLLESIVGSIFDEYDQEETEPIERIGEDYLFDGSVLLEDVAEVLDIPFREAEEEDCDTLGGFIFLKLGRIPEPEEKPVIRYEGYTFAVTEVSGRRIAQVHVSRTKPS